MEVMFVERFYDEIRFGFAILIYSSVVLFILMMLLRFSGKLPRKYFRWKASFLIVIASSAGWITWDNYIWSKIEINPTVTKKEVIGRWQKQDIRLDMCEDGTFLFEDISDSQVGPITGKWSLYDWNLTMKVSEIRYSSQIQEKWRVIRFEKNFRLLDQYRGIDFGIDDLGFEKRENRL